MKKSLLSGAYLMAGLASMRDDYEFAEEMTHPRLRKRSQESKDESLERNRKRDGLKEFEYSEGVIYARNRKNADRKAKNKGWV